MTTKRQGEGGRNREGRREREKERDRDRDAKRDWIRFGLGGRGAGGGYVDRDCEGLL